MVDYDVHTRGFSLGMAVCRWTSDSGTESSLAEDVRVMGNYVG
ncbi:hypothetical protein SAMN05421809_2351 [Natronorubrum daqingense]|uniref:Uncharacterized protein n=1 Tax=Natronorubrum daqingense TaxID=588898 RepID=A0A1N7DZJ3_9EURY|nr:hypothetical protein SAMN05421809_2351 [Natronorubrum daqingense]